MSKNTDLTQAWTQFITQWLTEADQIGFPEIESDDNWPSPCEFTEHGKTYWRPVLVADHIDSPLGFANIEEAVGIKLNEQFIAFFTLYFADGINAVHEKGPLQFLQAWSQSDFERLQQNIIGHLLMKHKLKQSPTLFFAVTDEDDLNLVVNNETGEVCLEYVGKPPHEVVAADLATFISEAKPVVKV